MKSPITGKDMKLVRERRTMRFRREGFEIMYCYYLCADSGEGFEDEACMRGNLERVEKRYRERYKVPPGL